MVYYCCVKGCKNTSNISKKVSASVTFHAFPTNSEMRRKWLRAIGRPNWDPPKYVRICSAHFSKDQVNLDGFRTRIKDNACPVKELPLNSNFEATHLKVCRICLASDIRMYTLCDEKLMMQFKAVSGFNDKCNMEGLPQFICYLCKAILFKCYSLIEKSMITQTILLDIFAESGQITKNLIKKHYKRIPDAISTLCSHFVTPSQVYEFEYSNEKNTSNLKTSYILTGKEEIEEHSDKEDIIKKINENVPLPNNEIEIDSKYKIEQPLCEVTENNDHVLVFNYASQNIESGVQIVEVMHASDEDDFHEYDESRSDISCDILERESCSTYSPHESPVQNTSNSLINNEESSNFQLNTHGKCRKARSERKRRTDFTLDEMNMEKYFDIVKLDLHQQLEEWKKSTETTQRKNNTVHKCNVCGKFYSSAKTLRNHIVSHDPSRGPSECPVCKQRYRNDTLMTSHRNRVHSKKFQCKSCPKIFNNMSDAKKHERLHEGYLYKCEECSFASVHAYALGVHTRLRHARGFACVVCGHSFVSAKGLSLHFDIAHKDEQDVEIITDAYRCDDCDVNFKSEGARRVHVLTSKFHKQKAVQTPLLSDPSLKTTCKWCGSVFATVYEMTAHARAEHRRTANKSVYRLPEDSYPTQCEHCSETVHSRREHWWHVRRQHPDQRGSYRAVITAVCHMCGKGFQNSTKLRIHLLRHSNVQYACEVCARVLRDPYALARHRAGHSGRARNYRCALCPRAFALKTNLVRHARVHTGVTPYECNICGKKFKHSTSVTLHVRTVHHHLPHPPRKKRTKGRPEIDKPRT